MFTPPGKIVYSFKTLSNFPERSAAKSPVGIVNAALAQLL
jgi:hypothetical protein